MTRPWSKMANEANSTGAEPKEALLRSLPSDAMFPMDTIQLLSVQVVLILAYSTIIVLGLVGNSLVIYVIYRFKTLRTVTNFFIANLAVADLLVNALCLPFTLVYSLQAQWRFGSFLCFLLPFAQGLAVHVSTVTLNVIALDRHRCIVYHLETRMKKPVCFTVIGLSWLLSAALASPLAIFREYGSFSLDGRTIQVCTEKWPGAWPSGAVYSVSMLVLQYFLPLSVISFAYAHIWTKLRSHVSPAESARSSAERHQRRHNATKMFITMVVVFAVSWLPFHAFQLATDIDSSVLDMHDFRLLYTLFHVVAMCSTFANPLLYGWMNQNYRRAFLSVFRCAEPAPRGVTRVAIRPMGKKKIRSKNRKPAPEPAAEPEPEPAAEPEPAPEPAAEPEPAPEPAAEPEPAPEPAAKPEPAPEPAAVPPARLNVTDV